MSIGHWIEAAERYREATRASDVVGDRSMQKQAQQEAAQELDELRRRIPTLMNQVDVDAAQVALTLDGVMISTEFVGVRRPTNPGTHRLVAMRGAERREEQVQLAEKEHKVVLLQLTQAVVQTQPAVERSRHWRK